MMLSKSALRPSPAPHKIVTFRHQQKLLLTSTEKASTREHLNGPIRLFMGPTSRSAFTCTQNRPADPASSVVATIAYCPGGRATRQDTSRLGANGRVRYIVSFYGGHDIKPTTVAAAAAAEAARKLKRDLRPDPSCTHPQHEHVVIDMRDWRGAAQRPEAAPPMPPDTFHLFHKKGNQENRITIVTGLSTVCPLNRDWEFYNGCPD